MKSNYTPLCHGGEITRNTREGVNVGSVDKIFSLRIILKNKIILDFQAEFPFLTFCDLYDKIYPSKKEDEFCSLHRVGSSS